MRRSKRFQRLDQYVRGLAPEKRPHVDGPRGDRTGPQVNRTEAYDKDHALVVKRGSIVEAAPDVIKMKPLPRDIPIDGMERSARHDLDRHTFTEDDTDHLLQAWQLHDPVDESPDARSSIRHEARDRSNRWKVASRGWSVDLEGDRESCSVAGQRPHSTDNVVDVHFIQRPGARIPSQEDSFSFDAMNTVADEESIMSKYDDIADCEIERLLEFEDVPSLNRRDHTL